MSEAALSYHEPDVLAILILASFLLILNVVGWALDNLIYCGLLGQIFIGVAWGSPGGNWLSLSIQQAVVQLGYLGLILLVYEGGLSTNIRAMKSDFLLSAFLALTGIVAPIGMSFVLMSLAHATPIQSFAAGASLCSTSLGTTLTVLKVSGLKQSRLGVVLTCAAMLDDVVGLVMAQIISNLGGEKPFSAAIVLRPILVSIAFSTFVPLGCKFLVRPLARVFPTAPLRITRPFLNKEQTSFLVHTLILLGFVVGSSYAGTSNLYAAYLAGASISWYDDEVNKGTFARVPASNLDGNGTGRLFFSKMDQKTTIATQVQKIYRRFVKPQSLRDIQERSHPAVPRCGSTNSISLSVNNKNLEVKQCDFNASDTGLEASQAQTCPHAENASGLQIWDTYYEPTLSTVLKPFFFASIGFSIPISKMFNGSVVWRGVVYAIMMTAGKFICGAWLIRSACFKRFMSNIDKSNRLLHPPVVRSLIAPSILGYAMVSRGEIGFLISALAESRGIFTSEQYFIVTWAIVLCTILGPVMVGFLTSKVGKIRDVEGLSAGEENDPMGIWA
ncbi:LAQU0S05e06678g1_1 [Lachancea quebecensis]|uniref:LAQU0S05e06678g1_1 n=1 Tax=Lachancea quebecensis TaxID=1654605 RepID=A0A0N7MLJ9_9SACH|nr:LAQU0S05e06678g1_1 [Lachancea quebecensis]